VLLAKTTQKLVLEPQHTALRQRRQPQKKIKHQENQTQVSSRREG
jgi:hypothetical protein